MTSSLTGRFEHQLDDKGRLTIPAQWRDMLAEGVFICPGVIGNCLYLWPKSRFEEIRQKLANIPYSNRDGLALQTHIGSGSLTKLDAQGRVFILPSLRAAAPIKDQVVLVGGFDRVEIWDPEERRLYDERELNEEARRKKVESLSI